MPPKPKYTREEIISCALDLVREKGEDALTSRELGARLNTSARPIFTAFSSMEELKACVVKSALEVFSNLQNQEISRQDCPKYKAIGTAYIRFASEEKNLFKLCFMRSREAEESKNSFDSDVIKTVENQTGLSEEQAYLFHTEMWIYTHGIAVTLATSYLELDKGQISALLTDGYQSFKQYYLAKNNLNGGDVK